MEISKMNYRDMLGFPKKKVKKVVTPIPRKPSITKKLKEEFGALNEWSEVDTGPKRWTGSGLTEFEQQGGKDNVNEGPAYEYAKYKKNIDKAWDNTQKAVMGLVKELHKKGLRKEALTIEKKSQASIRNFYHYFVEIMDKLE